MRTRSPPRASFKDSPEPIWSHPKLSSKIREACRIAREQGHRYLSIDSCCIDKTSSSELSESINSMYLWYALADVCYAFLVDVPAGDVERRRRGWPDFRRSHWFTRAWTLQELIAPAEVVFLAQDWTQIGSKVSLGNLIAEITKIEFDAFLHVAPLGGSSAAQRSSWAADREATRVEDRAYSLLGILDINMPTLYGEIMRRTPDQSLFAWTDFKAHPLSRRLQANLVAQNENVPLSFCQGSASSLLAPSLNVFSDCEDIKALSHDEVLRRLQLATDDLPPIHIHYDFTPCGICVQVLTVTDPAKRMSVKP